MLCAVGLEASHSGSNSSAIVWIVVVDRYYGLAAVEVWCCYVWTISHVIEGVFGDLAEGGAAMIELEASNNGNSRGKDILVEERGVKVVCDVFWS